MRLKTRIIGLIGALAIASIGLVGVSSPAMATTYSGTFDCSVHPGSTISGAASDTFNFTSLSNCGNIMMTASNYASASASNGAPVTGSTSLGRTYWQAVGITSFSFTLSNSVTGTILISGSPASATPPNDILSISIGSGNNSSSSSSVPSAPADVMQQVGVPADGKCSSIVDATLNWAGVSSGGWGTSWAQWMNGGKGGAVCNRALFYDLGLSKWGVRA